MKNFKWSVGLFLIVLLAVTGCLADRENKMALTFDVTAPAVSTESKVTLSITGNADYVIVAGEQIKTVGGTYQKTVDLKIGENQISVIAMKKVGSEDVKKEKNLSVFRSSVDTSVDLTTFTYTKKGQILFPLSGVFNGNSKAIKKTVVKDVTTPTDGTVQGGASLATVVATYNSASNSSFTAGDQVGMYLFINGRPVDYKVGTVNVGNLVEDGVLASPYTAVDSTIDFATGYTLKEGENQIAVVLVHLVNGATVYVGDSSGSAPVTLTVDSTNPITNLTYPLNGNAMNFTTASGAYGSAKLELSVQDSYAVTLYAALLLDDGVSTAATVKTLAKQIKRGGTAISAATSITIAKTDATTVWIDDTAAGSNWYLYVLAVDANANATPTRNYTFIKRKISGIDTSADLVSGQLKLSVDSGILSAYTAGMQINGTTLTFEYNSTLDKNATVKLLRRKLIGTTMTTVAEKTLSHVAGGETYSGTYDLAKDFGYTTLASTDNIDLMLEMTDDALNSTQIPVMLTYVDTSAVEVSILDSDVLFDDLDNYTAALTNMLVDNVESKVYFDYDGSTDISIKSLYITNPNNYDYKVRIDNNATLASESTTANEYDITDITLNATTQKAQIKIYLGETIVKTIDVVALVDFGDPNEDTTLTDTRITINEVILKQNKDKAYLAGTITMPANVKDEYTIQLGFLNATPTSSPWSTLTDMATVDENTQSFSGEVNFDKDASAATEYDKALVRAYNSMQSSNTVATQQLDAAANTVLLVSAIQITGLLDTDTVWKIGTEAQTIDVSNGGSFSSLELYLNGELYQTQGTPNAGGTNDFPTAASELSAVDVTGITTIKIVGTLSAQSKVKIEREITLTRPGASMTPRFVTVPELSQLYDSKFIVTGTVSNANKVQIIKVTYGGSDRAFVGGTYSASSPLNMTLLPDGTFYSADLADDTIYSTGTPGAGTYTSFAGDTGIIEGKEYVVTIRATKEGGASVDYEYTGKFDTLAPTQYHRRDAGNTYNKFDSNTGTMQWEINGTTGGDVLYFNSSGALKKASNDSAFPAAAELDTTGTDYTIATVGGDYTFSIDEAVAAPDMDKGYIAIIQNQKGYNDYLIAYLPQSDSDGDYTAVSGENYTMVVMDENNTTLLRKLVKTGDTGKDREVFLNLGDNKHETIKVYLMDEHLNKTGTYSFTNNLYLPMARADITAGIYEGVDENTSFKKLNFAQISGLDDVSLEIYKSSIDGDMLVAVPNVDLTGTSGYTIPLSGDISSGDILAIKASDKYGNNTFRENYTGYISTTVTDYLVPVLPTGVTVTNKTIGQLDIISGTTEANATVNVRDGSSNLIATTRAAVSGAFSVGINGDAYATVKLEIVDSNGNSTITSKLHDPYTDVTTLIARSYNYTITGVSADSGTFKNADTINVTWNAPAEVQADVDKGNIIDQYKIVYSIGAITFTTYTAINSMTIKPETIGTFDLGDVGVSVYGVSKLGLISAIAGTTTVKMDSNIPNIAGLSMSGITASVANDTVTVGATALTTATVGLGTSDKLYVNINGIEKEWTGVALTYVLAETGAITNGSIFVVKVKDTAGNYSTTSSITATDDEAPDTNNVIQVGSIDTATDSGDTYLYFDVKYTIEDNVTVYAYNGANPATASIIGVVKLGAKGVASKMTVKAANSTGVYLRLKDSNLPVPNYSTTKQLSTVTVE